MFEGTRLKKVFYNEDDKSLKKIAMKIRKATSVCDKVYEEFIQGFSKMVKESKDLLDSLEDFNNAEEVILYMRKNIFFAKGYFRSIFLGESAIYLDLYFKTPEAYLLYIHFLRVKANLKGQGFFRRTNNITVALESDPSLSLNIHFDYVGEPSYLLKHMIPYTSFKHYYEPFTKKYSYNRDTFFKQEVYDTEYISGLKNVRGWMFYYLKLLKDKSLKFSFIKPVLNTMFTDLYFTYNLSLIDSSNIAEADPINYIPNTQYNKYQYPHPKHSPNTYSQLSYDIKID